MKLDCLAEVCYKPLGEKGEDAFAYNLARDDIQAIAVFDGCGGAGAWKYQEFKNATGAFVASQAVANRFLSWFDTISPAILNDTESLANSFLADSRSLLLNLKNHCAPMGVSGSLVKSFPCTASIAMVSQSNNDTLVLTALNVGDSRVYFLTPSDGLVQLTTDDSRGHPDPLDSLRDNAPLSNLLNADKPYSVKTRQIALQYPFAILCATDGVFGFVRSPMDFEFLLLKSIVESNSIEEFENQLKSSIIDITGDDSTCLIAFYGWNSYSEIKTGLTPRYKEVVNIVRLINHAQTSDERENVIRSQWEKYKKHTVFDEMRG